MGTALGLVAVFLLILATGYFVAVEFAYVAARRARLEDGAAQGDRRSERALKVMGRLSFVLSGAQLGITVTSLVVGFIAQPTIGEAIRPLIESIGFESSARTISAVIAFVIATVASMVIGELAPKNLAIARPETYARLLASSTRIYLLIAGPLVHLFDGAANRLVRLFGVEPIDELATGVTPAELDAIVEVSAREGALTDRQAVLLSRALELPERQASEVMIPRPHVVTMKASATGAQVRAQLTGPYTRFPVVPDDGDLDDVVGVVHAEDLLRLSPAERDRIAVTELMRPPLLVPETAPVTALMEQLRSSEHEMAIVLDEYGGASGVLTTEDIVEELVGDIADEHDLADEGVRELGASRWAVPGTWRIDEIERDTGVVLPESDEYDTVAGLLMAELGRIPVVGDRVVVNSVTLSVTAMRRRQVLGVVIEQADA